jgi:hypothetical protein
MRRDCYPADPQPRHAVQPADCHHAWSCGASEAHIIGAFSWATAPAPAVCDHCETLEIASNIPAASERIERCASENRWLNMG